MLHTTTRMVAMTMMRMAMITRTLDNQNMMNFVSLLAFPTPMLVQINKDNDNHFETC